MIAVVVPIAIVAVVFALTVERAYTVSQYRVFDNGLRIWAYASSAAGLAAIAAAFVLRSRAVEIVRTRDLRRLLWATAAAFVVAALLAYVVRPYFAPAVPGGPDQQAIAAAKYESLVRLGWYMTLPGLVVAVAGVAAMMLLRPARGAALLLLLTLAPTVFYLQDPRVSADHIWASRRFIAASLPLASIAVGFVLAEVASLGRTRIEHEGARYAGMAAAAATTILIAGLMLRYTVPLAGHTEQQGAIDQVSAIARSLPPDAVVVLTPSFGGQLLAPPLKLMYGRDTFSVSYLQNDQTAIDDLLRRGLDRLRPVYYITTFDTAPPKDALAGVTIRGLAYTKTGEYAIDTRVLQLRFDGIPTQGTRIQTWGIIYRVTAAPAP
jgi:hypothetical protein